MAITAHSAVIQVVIRSRMSDVFRLPLAGQDKERDL